MPQGKSKDQEKPTPTLRRSPRFTAKISAKISAKKQVEVSKTSRKSTTRLRRSPRLSVGTPLNNGEDRRVTRGYTHGENSVEKTNGVVTRSGEVRVERPVLSSQVVGCGKDSDKKQAGLKRKRTQEACVERPVLSSHVVGCGKDDDKKQAGLKRKRTQGVEENDVANGWTNEQEVALQTAYFAAKPTPNFWKKVAKMVPGKSAKDCFDKIHSDFITPPQPQPRSRVKKMNTSSLSPCATKLLQFTEKNTNKQRYSKPKNHLSRKAVRQLLQKHTDIDRDKEADFFSALESSTDPTDKALCQNTNFFTPERKKEGLNYLRKCPGRSSSAHQKHRSRLSGSSVATLSSPPVLKPIKNKALHERYVDQLHCREAKRKAASTRTAKGQENKNGHKNENVLKRDVIKAAKNALISEARNAINQFQNLQTCAMNGFNDDDDDDGYDENHNCDDDEDAI